MKYANVKVTKNLVALSQSQILNEQLFVAYFDIVGNVIECLLKSTTTYWYLVILFSYENNPNLCV